MNQRPLYPDSEVRLTNAATAAVEGRVAEAEALYRQEPKNSRLHGVVMTGLAQLLARLGRWDEAEDAAEQAVIDFETYGPIHPPSWVLAHRVLGERAGDRYDLSKAATHFELACEIADNLIDRIKAELPSIHPPHYIDTLVRQLVIEKGHTLNSYGGVLLLAREPKRALVHLEAAQKCYSEVGNHRGDGVAETLTHLAVARRQTGDDFRAKLALDEAIEIAKERCDAEQLFRAYTELYALDPSSTDLPQGEKWRLDWAEQAEHQGQVHVAYVQWCIIAERLLEEEDCNGAKAAIERAARIENSLINDHLERAALRKTVAEICLHENDADGALKALLDGARKWSTVVSARSALADIEQVNRLMHEHFRMLARQLLLAGRTAEALCAFEHGRSLAHALQIAPSLREKFHGETFFKGVTTFPTTLLDSVRERLGEGEAVISLIMLPRTLAAFIVDRKQVLAVEELVEHEDVDELVEQLNTLPGALQEGKGEVALPASINSLASKITNALGDLAIAGFFPHALLHAVPWRALLRRAGLAWDRLYGITGFGLTSWAIREYIDSKPIGAIALGHGISGTVNFQEEALLFATAWGSGANVDEATRAALAAALSSENVVHLSCHGERVNDDVVLLLKDSSVTVTDIMEERPVNAPIVLLSACYSGTYFVRFGDHPFGPVPELLRGGARRCVGTRFAISARFAERFFPLLGAKLAHGQPLGRAFCTTLAEIESEFDLWLDVACVELLS